MHRDDQRSDDRQDTRPRVLLLTTPTSYRTEAFARAADQLGIETVQILDLPDPLAREWNAPLAADFSRPEEAGRRVAEYVARYPASAIIAVDDSATVVAAIASEIAGLPHNDPDAALAARDKYRMRRMLHAAGAPAPDYRRFSSEADPERIAAAVRYPCVVKPTLLNGSRGVIRADDPEQFVAAFRRTRAIALGDARLTEADILVEEFVPGAEVAVEGLLTDGSLITLAIFDKPDPLDGPFFEETIYVTPSRLPPSSRDAILRATAAGAAALGLRHGPIHAELRVRGDQAWIIEIAGRSIGGLCSTILEFGTGMSLEALILTHATGGDIRGQERADTAAGVMMIPIPGSGILREVEGVEEARRCPGVTGVEITAKLNHRIVPLPEGASYLGFIFAKGDTPDEAEASLRRAHECLRFRVSPEIPLLQLR